MANLRLSDVYNLEELALETGSTVEYASGRKFNTAGIQAKRPLKVAPTPAAAPPPPPAPEPKSELTAELMQQILSALNRPVEVKLPQMPAPQVTVAAPATAQVPVKWTFEFERNSNGTIKSITASSQE